MNRQPTTLKLDILMDQLIDHVPLLYATLDRKFFALIPLICTTVNQMLNQFNEDAVGFPGGSDGKESACIVRDLGSIPGSGASPGEGNGNPLQHSRLENSMDRRAWKATVHGVAKNWTRLSELHTRMLLD